MDETINAADHLKAIEDVLIPALSLDAHERSVYYHLFRHSRLVGTRTVKVSIDSLAAKTGLSRHVRAKLRSLESKGCVRIVDRGRSGTEVEVLIAAEIPVCQAAAVSTQVLDIESFDFFKDVRGRGAILERERRECFYCLRQINDANAVLDHAIPQVNGVDNSYRNIVAACHECNSLKAGSVAEDFARLLYRRGRLSASDLESRLAAIQALARGELKPRLPEGETA